MVCVFSWYLLFYFFCTVFRILIQNYKVMYHFDMNIPWFAFILSFFIHFYFMFCELFIQYHRWKTIEFYVKFKESFPHFIAERTVNRSANIYFRLVHCFDCPWLWYILNCNQDMVTHIYGIDDADLWHWSN